MLKTHTLAFVNGLLIGSPSPICSVPWSSFVLAPLTLPKVTVLIMSGLIWPVTLHYREWEEDHNLTLACFFISLASILIIVKWYHGPLQWLD